ncbi:MAG: hypothetical protein IJ297_02615 [Clostridia bacterium]|nr:hypothetical protein [Clostridia bacterium]
MKRILSFALTFVLLLTLSGCILKKSNTVCSECGSEDAYLYKIDHINKKVLKEKITVSYCIACYNTYLEETFGKGALAKAVEEDAHFKDVIGAGGYINDLAK